MRAAIDVEDEATWPAALRRRLDAGLADLRAFETEQSRVEVLAEDSPSIRWNPPQNPYANGRRAILDETDEIIRTRSLVGFHCSNLHPSEVEDVLKCGLIPLDRQLAARRVQDRVGTGDITEPVGRQLLTTSVANDANRCGLLWFIFTRSTLRAWSGISRFLTYWGGEALYRGYECDPVVSDVLKRIGRPVIIEAAVQVSRIACFLPVSERLLVGYLSRRNVTTEHGPEFEGYVRTRISGRRIRRMIRPDDPDFTRLTGQMLGDGGWSEAPG